MAEAILNALSRKNVQSMSNVHVYDISKVRKLNMQPLGVYKLKKNSLQTCKFKINLDIEKINILTLYSNRSA